MHCRVKHNRNNNMELFYIKIALSITIFLCATIIECCRFGPGSNCAFECRCKDTSEVCNFETGECQSGCAETLPQGYGWGGPGCRIGNLAFNKTAEQETAFPYYPSRNAPLDGDTNGNWYSNRPHSCSANNGWWMVDLGVLSVLHNITVYNRLDCCQARMKDTTIKIGYTPDPSEQQHCYTNNNSVKDVYEFTCDGGKMSGRYVQMRSLAGTAQNITRMNFCEFVVMGHSKIDCSMCNTSCNEVIGCDTCGPGLMLPDCKRSCPDGYFGINCMHTCSPNCAANTMCDHVTGYCICKKWWMPDLHCDIFLGLEWLPEENMVQVMDVTSYSITIQWHGISYIPVGYENHYKYTIHYTSKNNKEDTVTVQHNTTMVNYMTHVLSDLAWNTNYTIWITPYRVWKHEREAGETFSVTTKTKCADPEQPEMDIQDRGDEFIMRIQDVTVFASRCDKISSYYLSYECQTDGGFISSEYNISVSGEEDHSIYYGKTLLSCTAWLDVWNNEGFGARSVYTLSNIDSPESKDFLNNSMISEFPHKENNKGPGAIIGGCVGGGIAVLISVGIVVTCVAIKRRRQASQTTKETLDISKIQSGQNENLGTDNGSDTTNTETNIGYHNDGSDGYQALDFVTGTQ